MTQSESLELATFTSVGENYIGKPKSKEILVQYAMK